MLKIEYAAVGEVDRLSSGLEMRAEGLEGMLLKWVQGKEWTACQNKYQLEAGRKEGMNAGAKQRKNDGGRREWTARR